MHKPYWFLRALLLLALLTIPAVHAQAQSLSQTIASLDTELFDAYNHCDLEKLGTLVTDDLEFYHDQTGLSVGRAIFIESIKTNICGKLQRKLISGTLEVYPLKGYGAVEIGVHRFYHPGRDRSEPVGEAKFVMLWQNKDGAWRLTRVISYDHAAVPK